MPSAMRGVRRGLTDGAVRAVAGVRQAWWRSSETFWEVPDPLPLDVQRLARERERAVERRLQRQRTLAAGSVVYEGRIRVRPGSGRVVLADAPGRPGLDYWLAHERGLDGYGGDYDYVRITVHPGASPHPQPDATDR